MMILIMNYHQPISKLELFQNIKIDIEYKDNKTGKIVSEKNDNKIDNKLFQDNGDFDKAIYHPFLIDDDTVNI